MPSHSQNSGADAKRPFAVLKNILSVLAPSAIAFVVFMFILGIGYVNGSSMAPLYDDHTVILFSRWAEPKYQDIICVQSTALSEVIVKRVIGLPGDTLEIKNGVVYRNAAALDEPYVEYPGGPDLEKLTVPDHMLFVLGDNRLVSLDSRSPLLGFIPDSEVAGTVFFHFQSPLSSEFFQKLRSD